MARLATVLLWAALRDDHSRGDHFIDARAQALVARLSLSRKVAEPLEAETLTLSLIRRALGEQAVNATRASAPRQKLVDRAKLVLSSDLARRWTLAEIATRVGNMMISRA